CYVSLCFSVFSEPVSALIDLLPLHDALPICVENKLIPVAQWAVLGGGKGLPGAISLLPMLEIMQTLQGLYAAREQVKQDLYEITDRKSTRLNSSHVKISYAVFCLKKKKQVI